MKQDRIVAICCLMIGLFISISSIRLGLGDIRDPGAGLFSFLIGIVIIVLSVIIFQGKREESVSILGTRWKSLLLVLSAIIFYSLALDRLGFLLTTFVFMIVISRSAGPQKWSIILLLAILSTLCAYLVFSLGLKLEFPKGIIGI